MMACAPRGWARAAVLAACVGVIACGASASSVTPAPVASTATAAAEQPLVPVQPGWVAVLMPAKSIDVAPEFEGEIAELTVGVGQAVEQGGTLAKFDTDAAREELAIAKADLLAAKGAAAQAAAAAKGARRKFLTEQRLAAQGYSAAEAVADARAESGRTGGATSNAAGQVAAARARVDALERRLRETQLVAPFAGRVAVIYREQGALAGPGAPLVRLIDTSGTIVRFAVSPADAASLPTGTAVEVVVDWLPQALPARVHHSAPEIDAPTGMVFVEAEVDGMGGVDVPPQSPAWVRAKG